MILQLKKAIRKGKLTFIATVKLKPLDVKFGHELVTVAKVLKKFTDIMSLELLKTMPPPRGIDDLIELEPRVKPSARTQDLIAPLELAKLKKQLDELLNYHLI